MFNYGCNLRYLESYNKVCGFSELMMESYYREVYEFMIVTGLRIAEIGAIRWCDIDFDRKIIQVKRTLHKNLKDGTYEFSEPKNKSSIRIVPFFRETEKILLNWKKKQEAKIPTKKRVIYLNSSNLIFTEKFSDKPITNIVLSNDIRLLINRFNKTALPSQKKNRPSIFDFREAFKAICYKKNLPEAFILTITGQITYDSNYWTIEKLTQTADCCLIS